MSGCKRVARAKNCFRRGVMMKKRVRAALCGCAIALLLSGCGGSAVPETVEETTILLNRDGSVTYYLAGMFDREYYDLTELADMAKEEAAEFSRTNGASAVSVEKAEYAPGDSQSVVITYRFADCGSFQTFQESSFFYGTTVEAAAAGYRTADVTLQDADGAETSVEKGGKLIVTAEKAYIYCPAKVLGASGGAVIREDGSVDTTAAEGIVYILLKK